MARPTFEDVMQAWTADYDSAAENTDDLFSQELKLSTNLLKLLAKSKPVSVVRLAEQTGLSHGQVEAIFGYFATQGGEFDEEGNLVGAALTLIPTNHQLTIDGRHLYAWCSLDTLFLPGLIDKPAKVSSTDPVTGESIHLTISPEGVADYTPSSTVLSITVPGLSCRTDRSCGPKTGPQSEACSQMQFFASRESAEVWLENRLGIAILSVDEAWQLAERNWLERSQQLKSRKQETLSCAC